MGVPWDFREAAVLQIRSAGAGGVGETAFQSFRWKPSEKQCTSQLQLQLPFVSASPVPGIVHYEGCR